MEMYKFVEEEEDNVDFNKKKEDKKDMYKFVEEEKEDNLKFSK